MPAAHFYSLYNLLGKDRKRLFTVRADAAKGKLPRTQFEATRVRPRDGFLQELRGNKSHLILLTINTNFDCCKQDELCFLLCGSNKSRYSAHLQPIHHWTNVSYTYCLIIAALQTDVFKLSCVTFPGDVLMPLLASHSCRGSV